MTKKRDIPKGLTYWGSKNPLGKKSEWITSIIGQNTKVLYCEPFAGMLGILLARPKSTNELANDANGWLISWWKAIRDHHQEFRHKVHYTPRSRELCNDALEKLKSPCTGNVLDDALTAHIAIEQSIHHSLNTKGNVWVAQYGHSNKQRSWTYVEVDRLHERIKDIQIECDDANKILKRIARVEKSIIYVDPPYDNSSCHYGGLMVDKNEMTERLKEQKGEVFISGYGDEWDHLGWKRYESPFKFWNLGTETRATDRIEVLWAKTNTQRGLF